MIMVLCRLRAAQLRRRARHLSAGAPGEPLPDLEIHKPKLLALFERFYAEHAPLSFRLDSMVSHRVLVTVHDSSSAEVGHHHISTAG